MTGRIYPVELAADSADASQLVPAARMAGLVGIDLTAANGTPQIVYREGRRAAAEALGRRLVVAMREAVRPCDGHDDPAGAAVAALVAFVELCGQPTQPTPAAFRAAVSALVDAATPYTRGERSWDERDRTMVLTNAQRAWIRSWAGLRKGEI